MPEKISALNYIPKKAKILLILTIVFTLYLIFSVQLTPNLHNVCRPFINGTTCDGNPIESKGIVQCCKEALVYKSDDNVPKHTITPFMGIIWFVLFISTIMAIINALAKPDFLDIEDAMKILKNHFKKSFSDYHIEIGPVAKLRYFLQPKTPFKWGIAARTVDKDSLEEYWLAEVSAFWRSNKLEDHMIAMRKMKGEVTASIMDKELTGDVYIIESQNIRAEREYKERTKVPKND